MNKIDKYIRLAKSVVVKPEKENIEEKIIRRIENLSEEDRKLLDDRFVEYLKKNNSRVYLFMENIKNHPHRLILPILFFLAVLGIFLLILGKSPLSSSNDNTKDYYK